jgi:hypothetical protein
MREQDKGEQKRKDLSREPNAVVPETESGTTADRDFGKSDRYANKDEGADFNFRTTGDDSSWDTGREASISEGTQLENDTRAADAETPGVRTKRSDESL